jgi:O-antigen/teichoic acid export membrane protein
MLKRFLSTISKRIGENSFFGNMLALMSANIIAQAISISASFVTAKLYSPAEMGIYSNYTSILTVLTVVICLHYDRAIILPDDDRDAQQLLGLCAASCLCISGVYALIFLPFHTWIAAQMNAPELGPWLQLMPLSTLLGGTLSILQYWNSRRKTLDNVALSNAVQTASGSGSQILLGLKPIHLHGGMIFGTFIGKLISAILLFRKTLSQEEEHLFSGVNIWGFREAAVRYRHFLSSIPGGLCDQLCSALPTLGLTYFFGSAEAGYYGLGHRLLALPLSIINTSVGQAFFPEAKAAYNAGTLKPLCLRTVNLLLHIGTVPFLLLALVAPALVSFVFGSKWYTAGEYIKWLSLWLLLGFVYSPLAHIFSVVEQPQKYTVLNTINLAVRAVALLLGGMIGDPALTIVFCGISGALVSIFNCAYVLRLVQISLREILTCIVRQFFHALLYTLPTLFSLAVIGQNMTSAVVAVLSGCVFLLIETRPILHSLQAIGKDEA